MAFKIQLLSDVRDFLRGTADVEKGLDDVADSLDDLARETAQNADDAADKLEREFSDAFDKVKTEARSTGRSVGDDLDDGARRAERGLDELKDSGRQNAMEVAASFDGSAESIADGFQGLAAEAFAGFGPAGMAAGLAAAAGMGLISSALESAGEEAEQTKERIAGIRDELDGLNGDVTQLDYASAFKEWGEETTDGMKNIERMNQLAVQLGVDQHTLYLAWTGDEKAKQIVQDAAIAKQKEINDLQEAGDSSDSLRQRSSELNKNVNLLGQYVGWVDTASDGLQNYNSYIGDSADKTAELTEAQQEAANAAETFENALESSVDGAIAATGKLVDKGRVHLEEWIDGVEKAQRRAKRIEKFTVDVFPELSAEAQQRFSEMPTETQDEIVRAYRNGSKGQKKKIRETLEIDAEPKINVQPAQAEADKNPVTVPTTVDASATQQQTSEAIDAGQREADKPQNEIELKTKIDRDELQRQINRAAASISPPTIYVKTKTQKEVP